MESQFLTDITMLVLGIRLLRACKFGTLMPVIVDKDSVMLVHLLLCSCIIYINMIPKIKQKILNLYIVLKKICRRL